MSMDGVIKDGAETLQEDGDEIGCTLALSEPKARGEHYEMAGYTTAISPAQCHGQDSLSLQLQDVKRAEYLYQ